MTREQKKKMKSYIIPKPYYYDKTDDTKYVLKMSMFRTIDKSIGSDAMADIVEDTIMEVYMDCMAKDKYYGPYMFARTVKTYYFRKLYKMRGLTAKGEMPKNRGMYVQNEYDDEGNNIIDTYGKNDDWYDELIG